jgi:SAM-dependent methyltransferase
MTPDDWPAYYEVTVERPAWSTTTAAIELFAAEDGSAAHARLAVDLGCGAGRDARALLRAGWRVLAVDREQAAIDALLAATPPGDRGRLETRVADIAGFPIPACDLVNANLSLQFLDRRAYAAAWAAIRGALVPGGRVAAMVFGDRDEAASDPAMTCPSPRSIRARVRRFDVECWTEREEDGQTALGEPHHIHLVEFVARRRDGTPAPGRLL